MTVRPIRCAATVVLAAGIVILAAPLAQAGAAPITPPGPAWEIALTDRTTEVRSGAHATYQVTLSNRGRSANTKVNVRLSGPGQVTFASGDKAATVHPHEVSWTVALPAGATVTVQAAATVGALPNAGQRGIAVSACAYQAAGKAPVVCAADIDQIPGAPPIHQASADAAGSHPASLWAHWWAWASVGGTLVLALCGAGVLLVGPRVRRRRSRHHQARVPASAAGADADRAEPVGTDPQVANKR